MGATDQAIDPAADFGILNEQRRQLRRRLADLGPGPAPTPAAEKQRRLEELETKAELANVEKQIGERHGPPLPLKAGSPIASPADVDRRRVGISEERVRLGAARKAANSTAELGRIDTELKALDDEELVLANQRKELARQAQAEADARARADQAAETERRYRLYHEADAIFGEILVLADRLDALRRASGLEDVAPCDFDSTVMSGRRWLPTFEALDKLRWSIERRWRTDTMPPVRAWAAERAPRPEPRRTRGIFGRGAH